MHVLTFAATETNKHGTFQGVIDKLDHLKYLGVNCIEFLPLHLDSHDVCWGYDPVSMFAIHNHFGTLQDLMRLVNECHKRGIAVITDWVPNHSSPHNVFTKFDSQESSCYFNNDEKFRHTDYGPKLNIFDKNVRNYLFDSLKYWVTDLHFDGVRVDSTVTLCTHSGN